MTMRSPVQASDEDRAALRRLARSARRGEADRARAILLTLDGQRAEDIARSLGAHVSTVHEWRGLYAEGGAAALRYRPASGGRPGSTGRQALACAQAILAEDTAHDRHWTLPRLSPAARIAHAASVQRHPELPPWRHEDLPPGCAAQAGVG